MGNFDYLQNIWPDICTNCCHAESYLDSDPRAALIYSRRSIELLVDHLYRLKNLGQPYRDDLAAKINDAAFARIAGPQVIQKFTYIRQAGNAAVHDARELNPKVALPVLRELFHLCIWAAFNHSASPEIVPTRRQFDPELARKSAPLTEQEATQLLQKFEDQDRKHREELERRDQDAAAMNAEIERLRQLVEEAQSAKTVQDDHDYKEEETRDHFIDLLLLEAGWPLKNPEDREYPVQDMPTPSGTGRVDYVLWGSDGTPLGLVEAKRTRKSAEEGRDQAKYYADALEKKFGSRPVIFYTNGQDHRLWDDAAGYPPRDVAGFLTAEELERMVRRRGTRKKLTSLRTSSDIAGRPYQQKAITAVAEEFDQGRRKALLVMATGTGKTRTVIALTERLMKAGWAKRILFLADRTSLVKQAANAFRSLLPDYTTVNLLQEKNTEGRVYVSTYPTILNMIHQLDGSQRRFGPGYFDVVVIDEAHRSVYAKYGEIFDWFDSLLIGLTATPKDEVDHNTYRLFELEDGVPTEAYGLDEAIADDYLVPPTAISIGSKFLRQGIRYDDLTEEEKTEWDALEWDEDGEIPDEVGAEEINKYLFNVDTVDKVLETLMTQGHTVEDGERLGKTIIFAKSQRHAEFIQERFDAQWPQYGGNFARIITHSSYGAQDAIDKFSIPEAAPHIAISVDMLDTGIDVPEVVNLVFFKAVHSRTKFWQMIGRGTRLRPDLYGPGKDKEDFYVFDFCGNLEFFNQDMVGAEGTLRKSLTHRLFETRVDLLRAIGPRQATAQDGEPQDTLRSGHAEWLHTVVAGMTPENPLVRKHRFAAEKFSAAEAWENPSEQELQEAATLGGLPTTFQDTDTDAKRFDLILLSSQLAVLTSDATTLARAQKAVQEIAGKLEELTTIDAVRRQAPLLEALQTTEWWEDVTAPMLEEVRERLRGFVRLIERKRRLPVIIDVVDQLMASEEVELKQVTPGVNMKRFKEKARAYLREHEDNIALRKLQRNRQLTESDLRELEEMLYAAGGEAGEIQSLKEKDGGLGLFVRSLVGLDQDAVQEAFAELLDQNRYSVQQIRFIELIVKELTLNGSMSPGRLYEDPYRNLGSPDAFFPEAQVIGIASTITEFRNRAIPETAA